MHCVSDSPHWLDEITALDEHRRSRVTPPLSRSDSAAGRRWAAEATAVDQFSFASESATLIVAGHRWALHMQIRRRDPADQSCAQDDRERSGPGSKTLFGAEDAEVRRVAGEGQLR